MGDQEKIKGFCWMPIASELLNIIPDDMNL
jgi:hypothetical protein